MNKYVIITSVISAFLFTISGSLHWFLWLQVTIWSHFLSLLSSFVLLLYCISMLKAQLHNYIYIYSFIPLYIKSIKSREEKQYAFLLTFIVTFIDVLCFFHVELNYCLGSLPSSLKNFL